MSILSKADYLTLSTFIGDEREKLNEAAALARSGLVHVVLLQDVDQEVALLADFYPHSQIANGIRDGFAGRARAAVTALNKHVIDFSGMTLNAWLADNTTYPPAIQVTQDFADVSAAVGFTITSGNIEDGA